MMELIVKVVLAYLLGSVSGSLLLGRLKSVDIREQGSGNAGERHLSRPELAAVWAETETWALRYRIALRLLLATGQRVEEVLGMHRDEIVEEDGQLMWIIPGTRRKTGKEHLVPLVGIAADLVREAMENTVDGAGRLFPSVRGGASIGATTFGDVLRRKLDVPNFTARDSRRTWKTLAGSIGIDLELRNRIQGHDMGGVGAKHYDRYSYRNEKTAALRRYDIALQEWIGGDRGKRVVEIVKR